MQPQAPQPPRFGRAFLISGLLFLALGLIAIALSARSIVPFFSELVFAEAHPVPGSFTENLDEGQYVVSFQTNPGSRTSPGIDSLSITGPDGAQVTWGVRTSESLQRNDEFFRSFASFDADQSGVYRFDVETTRPTNAVVTRSLLGFGLSGFLGFVLLPFGFLACLLGSVLLIVYFIKGRKKSDPSAPRPPFVPY